MATSAEQLASVAPRAGIARTGDRVYRDECVLSFDSALSPDGLYTNLATFLSYGAPFRRFDPDARRNGTAVYLHQRHTKTLKPKEESSVGAESAADAPTKLAIGGEGGFAVNPDDKFTVTKQHEVVVFDATGNKELVRVSLSSADVPERIKQSVESVLSHVGSVVAEEVATWQEELKETKYAEHLVQVESPPKISSNPSQWKCQAPTCDKQENLWLNLSDGYIGCGRKNWDGTGGCGAALDHFAETGGMYPLSVKLGTITAEGGDVYSYAPDEDDMVSNKLLTQHLAHFGINVANLKKTDKSMNELQVGLNLSYEFDTITEAGKKLQNMTGAGYIGFKNLGNSCYMNSVLQLLLALPEIKSRYFDAADRIDETIAAGTIPPDDFAAQLAKLARGVLTDRYRRSFTTTADGAQEEDEVHTQELRPITFRGLVGKNHSDFSTGQQQDAVEYFQYLLDIMTRNERVATGRIGELVANAPADLPTASLFKFKFEDRVECLSSHKVKYVPRDDTFLQMHIPLEAATNATQVKEYQASSEQKRQRIDAGGDASAAKSEKDEAVLPIVPFEACVEKTLAPELIEDFLSSATGKKGLAQKTVRFKSFPRYLVVQMRRFYVDEDWTPKKLDAVVNVPEHFSLTRFISHGLADGEQLLPEDDGAAAGTSSAGGAADVVTPDDALVAQLVSMGFSENGCKRAAIATGNANAEVAMEWIFSHMEDPDFNDPPAPAGSSGGADSGAAAASVNMDLVSNLMAMGFAESHVTCALRQTSNDPDRAAEWLFSHMDDLDAAVAVCESETAAANASAGSESANRLDNSAGEYDLVGFVSHIGKNTSSGHYVSHIKKDGRWVIFNDDKVALSEEPPLGAGYLYLFRRAD